MKKDIFIIIGIILVSAGLYAATLRGAPGNPVPSQFRDNLDLPTKAFELSPERGRYTQVVNLADRGVYDLTPEWGAVAYPDVGISPQGKISSYFAPGASYFALPFYLVGRTYNLGQVAVFASQALISILTIVFIYLIGRRAFKLSIGTAIFAALLFGFGSTSWSYAVTLYEHAFSAFFEVTAFYATWRFAQKDSKYGWAYAAYVWFAYAASITINYPDALLMLPIMVYLAYSTFEFKQVKQGVAITVRWVAIVASVVFVLVTSLHFWHNAQYYGGWSKLAGGLKGYVPPTSQITTTSSLFAIEQSTQAVVSPSVTTTAIAASSVVTSDNKSVIGFFKELHIPKSFYILILSDERGLLFFMPVYLFSFLGILYMIVRQKKDQDIFVIPTALIVLDIFLYSSWGDPWGGWAFGPRYLIQIMPWLALFVGVAIERGWGNVFAKKSVAYVLFLYSSALALLGALTTNAVPPKSEAVLLPLKTYNYLHDIPFLQTGQSSSYVYNAYFADSITLINYYAVLYFAVAALAVLALFVLPLLSDKTGESDNHHD